MKKKDYKQEIQNKTEFQYYGICSHTGINHRVMHNEIPAVHFLINMVNEYLV